ncbi:serine hydroxymethyltransferase [Candidatus Woesearchaeota archaeon]|nr:serine hydroxymethyltransferase [Candidatus Woesearchaeota archaeon]
MLLRSADSLVFDSIQKELARQQNGLEMIPSENIVSIPVLEALGSVFTNKYSEGYPKKRYYGGNEFVDEIELLAIERAKRLFGAEHVNVQPLSGSPANQAAYNAMMETGDKLMGLKLDHGGHLTHGHKVNFSGRLYNVVPYEVSKDTEMLDYDVIGQQAVKEKPKLIVAGFTAYPRRIDFKRFREIADSSGAYLMVDMSHFAGLVAGKAHPNPVPFADIVTTTTHKTLRGPRGAMILCREEFAKAVDKAVFPGLQGGPHDHVTAAKAVAFGEALKPEFRDYAEQIVSNAQALAGSLVKRGIRLVSGGTDTHLLLANLTNKGIPGKVAESALDKAGIYVNKNTIPFDPRTPFDPSGIRLGTPTLTSRGMKQKQMELVAGLICDALDGHNDEASLLKIREDVLLLCNEFPIYRGLVL